MALSMGSTFFEKSSFSEQIMQIWSIQTLKNVPKHFQTRGFHHKPSRKKPEMRRNLLIFRKSTHAESHFQAQSLYKLLDLPNMSKFRPISDFFLGGVWWNPRVWKCFGTFFSVCIDHICIICSENELFSKKVEPMLRVIFKPIPYINCLTCQIWANFAPFQIFP